jgi:hypothetical protein
MKIHLVGAELFHAYETDGQTDVTKLINAFRNFTKAQKNHNFAHAVFHVSFFSQNKQLSSLHSVNHFFL